MACIPCFDEIEPTKRRAAFVARSGRKLMAQVTVNMLLSVSVIFLGIANFYSTRSHNRARQRLEQVEVAIRELNPGLNI